MSTKPECKPYRCIECGVSMTWLEVKRIDFTVDNDLVHLCRACNYDIFLSRRDLSDSEEQ